MSASGPELMKLDSRDSGNESDEDEGTPLGDLGLGKEKRGVSFGQNSVRKFDNQAAPSHFEEDLDMEAMEMDGDEGAPRYDRRRERKRPEDESEDGESGTFLDRKIVSVDVKVVDGVCLALAVLLVMNMHKIPFASFVPDVHMGYKIAVVFIVLRILWMVLRNWGSKLIKSIRSTKKDKRRQKR
jgi:hypothetical protein